MYYSSQDQNNTGELNNQAELERWKTEHHHHETEHHHHHETSQHHKEYEMPYMMEPMSYCPCMETCKMKECCPMLGESTMMSQMDPGDPDPRFTHFHHHFHHHFFHPFFPHMHHHGY